MVYRDSLIGSTTLELQGVWIMDPATGGQGSARGYPYGAAQREERVDPMGEATYYAGRVDPVTDYGEHEYVSMAVTLDVPHGPTWQADLEDLRAFALGKRIMHVRDNRGRALYGTLEGFRIMDQTWGSQATFTVERRGYPVEVVTL